MGHTLAIMSGLIWIGGGLVLMEISRILGPAYNTTRTVHPFWRGVAWVGAVTFFVGGATLLFPGQLIETSSVSLIAPARALGAFGVTLALLDWIMRDRSPPPWSTVATVQMLRLAALLGRTGPVMKTATALPIAGVGDVPPPYEPVRQRRSRLIVLATSLAIALGILAFLAATASAG